MAPRIHTHRRLPSTETYACSKNEAKLAFEGLDELDIHFGDETHFEFEHGVRHPPKLDGWVIATALVTREGNATVSFFPLRKQGYAQREHRLFVEAELIRIRDWVCKQQDLPEAQVVSNRQLLLESVVDGFVHHQVEFA